MKKSIAMRLLLVTCLVAMSACMESEEDLAAERDELREATAEAPAPSTPEDLQALALTEVNQSKLNSANPMQTTVRRSNCGHMVWCNSGGRARYCYFNQANTGCSMQDINNDFWSDCHYVCGREACYYSSVRPC